MNDWDQVTILKKKPLKSAQMKTESAINAARRQGATIETTQKCKSNFGTKLSLKSN